MFGPGVKRRYYPDQAWSGISDHPWLRIVNAYCRMKRSQVRKNLDRDLVAGLRISKVTRNSRELGLQYLFDEIEGLDITISGNECKVLIVPCIHYSPGALFLSALFNIAVDFKTRKQPPHHNMERNTGSG